MKATAGVQGWPRGTGRGGLPWKPLLGTQDRPLPWERGPQERVGSPRGPRLSSPFLSGGLWPLLAPTSTVGSTWGPEALSEHVHLAWNVGGRGGRSHTHRGGMRGPRSVPPPRSACCERSGLGGRVSTGCALQFSAFRAGSRQCQQAGARGPGGARERCGAACGAACGGAGRWGQEATGQGLALQIGPEPQPRPGLGKRGRPPRPAEPSS